MPPYNPMTPGPVSPPNYVQPWGQFNPRPAAHVDDVHDPRAKSRQPLITERSRANLLAQQLGIRQESVSGQSADIITPVPNGNPMNVSAAQWTEQPDYRNPVGRAEAPITKYNPMGC